MMKKSRKSGSGGGKIEENREGGASKRQQNAKLEKIGVVSSSPAPFLSIFVEQYKIDATFYDFLIGFWMRFGRDFGAKMGENSMQKRCQKHVGIDLEVELAKTLKMTPLAAFLLF